MGRHQHSRLIASFGAGGAGRGGAPVDVQANLLRYDGLSLPDAIPCPSLRSRSASARAATARASRTRPAAPVRRSSGRRVGSTTSSWIGTARSGVPGSPLLARRHTLVRYDWRGCGLSDREQVEFSFEKFVEDLEAVIDAAGLEQFVLFGVAAGAAIGMTYAVRHPGASEPSCPLRELRSQQIGGQPDASGSGGGASPAKSDRTRLVR